MRDSEAKQETDPAKGHYGVEHPEMLRSMSNLALVLDQHEKAEEMHRQALEAWLSGAPVAGAPHSNSYVQNPTMYAAFTRMTKVGVTQ
jgi:hypothetical protein